MRTVEAQLRRVLDADDVVFTKGAYDAFVAHQTRAAQTAPAVGLDKTEDGEAAA